jgi:hypothetical protein
VRLKEQATLIHAGQDSRDREHHPIEFAEINGEAEASVASNARAQMANNNNVTPHHTSSS